MEIQKNRSNPKDIDNLLQRLSDNTQKNIKIKVEYTYFNHKHENMAVLLISYLLLFKYFGYSYVFNRWGLETREAIINGNFDSRLLTHILRHSQATIKTEEKTLIILCSSPNKFRDSAFIQLHFETDYSLSTYQIVLPFMPDMGIQDKFWSRYNGQLEIKGNIIDFSPEFLKSPPVLSNVKPK